MPESTRGGLKPAKIYDPVDANFGVSFMFNPNSYRVDLAHNYTERGMGGNTPLVEISNLGQKRLTLAGIIFDTYEAQTNVTFETDKLWALMSPIPAFERGNGPKASARPVTFAWGSFGFTCFVESISQTFTLFLRDGTPVRAEVDLVLKQYLEGLPKQNPTSGDGPIQRIWRVKAGDRLDTIAAEVYQDATLWREIAIHNDIANPFKLTPGLEIGIPPRDVETEETE